MDVQLSDIKKQLPFVGKIQVISKAFEYFIEQVWMSPKCCARN